MTAFTTHSTRLPVDSSTPYTWAANRGTRMNRFTAWGMNTTLPKGRAKLVSFSSMPSSLRQQCIMEGNAAAEEAVVSAIKNGGPSLRTACRGESPAFIRERVSKTTSRAESATDRATTRSRPAALCARAPCSMSRSTDRKMNPGTSALMAERMNCTTALDCSTTCPSACSRSRSRIITTPTTAPMNRICRVLPARNGSTILPGTTSSTISTMDWKTLWLLCSPLRAGRKQTRAAAMQKTPKAEEMSKKRPSSLRPITPSRRVSPMFTMPHTIERNIMGPTMQEKSPKKVLKSGFSSVSSSALRQPWGSSSPSPPSASASTAAKSTCESWLCLRPAFWVQESRLQPPRYCQTRERPRFSSMARPRASLPRASFSASPGASGSQGAPPQRRVSSTRPIRRASSTV